MTIEDLLARWTGIQFFDWRTAIQAAPVAAELLAGELGWSKKEQAEAVKSYTVRIEGFLQELGLSGAA